MKNGFYIEMIEIANHKTLELYSYQYLIDKLINFAYKTRTDIIFIIEQPIKYNTNP